MLATGATNSFVTAILTARAILKLNLPTLLNIRKERRVLYELVERSGKMLTLKERKSRAQEIVQRIETSLVSQNGQLRQTVLDFREAFLNDVRDEVLVEVWPHLFETKGWGWLEKYGFPVFARNELKTVFLSQLDERLESAKTN